MKSYLEEKITEIYNEHSDHLDEIVIIIPNKRAAVYIYKYLSGLTEKPFFPPEILTIHEWIDKHIPKRIVNSTELIFISYKIHKDIEGDQAESFDSFLKWAPLLIADFNEIDRNLVNPKQIFSNLKEIKEIENWSFDADDLSEGQKKFSDFWEKIPLYYNELNKELSGQNLIYSGKANEEFLNLIENFEKFHYFLGFNALSKSENQMIRQLIKSGKAKAYFDVDRFCYENSEHEAGHFYRKLIKEWEEKPELSENLTNTNKEFHIIETAQQVVQAKIAGSIIHDLIQKGDDLSSTAIVLADESLLIPLLNALPPNLKEANVTMGYPIKYSHLKSMVDLIFELQFNFNKFDNEQIYFRNFLNLVSHPYIKVLLKEGEIQKLESHILDHNLVFLQWAEVESELSGIKSIKSLFSKWVNPSTDGLEAFNNLNQILYSKYESKAKDHQLDLELIDHFIKGIDAFNGLVGLYKYELDLKSFKHLFYQFWQNETLSFLGNPIEGLQIMGILETRTIDFKNIIFLGMNEGALPKASFNNSFIPYDLKKHFGLPVDADHEAIFAHHFYRLIHRAENIWMTYNSSVEAFSGAEQSRYIIQLENEFQGIHKINRATYSGKDVAAEIRPVQYLSTKEVHQKLDEILERGLSPSALNKLLDCPLNFYYRYILGMKEENEVEENIESSTFGTNIHSVLERIIEEGFLRGEEFLTLSSEILKTFESKVGPYLKEEYLKDFSERDLMYGQNRLSLEVSERFLKDFIKEQIKALQNETEPVQIVTLEKSIEANYEIEINGDKKKVRLYGQADRIEKVGDLYRIIDYKSGACQENNVKISSRTYKESGLKKLMTDRSKRHCRQLLMYGLMFRQENPQVSKFSTGIISMVKLKDWLQNVIGPERETLLSDDLLNEFEEEVFAKIRSLYEADFVFEHDPEAKYCEHCES